MFFTTIIDLFSLGLIAPYVANILNINSSNYQFLNFLTIDYLSEDKLTLILTVILMALFLTKTILSISLRWLISVYSYKFFKILQVKLMHSYQFMDYQDYISRAPSEYIRNIRELCMDCLLFVDYSLRIISEAIILFAIIIFLAFLNLKILVFLILIILPVLLFYELYLKPINKKLGMVKIESLNGMYKNIYTGMQGLKEFRILSKENFFKEKIDYYANSIYEITKKSVLIKDTPRYIFEFIIVFVALLIFLILSKNNLPLNEYLPLLSIYLLAALRFLPGISLITSNLNKIGHGSYAVKKVFDDLKKYSKLRLSNDKNISNSQFESLELKNINFSYQNDKMLVFEDLNFKIKKNSCIGIIGESGAGKTTFLDLILGLLKPQNGLIKINDKTYDKITNEFLNQVAYMPQDSLILDETIKTNITLELDENNIDQQKLLDALTRSNFKRKLNTLKNGLETKIGEGGIRLSGGQKKMLALARIFYHNKKVLVIDEATASLDTDSEDFFTDQIKKIKHKVTIIIISHNLSTLQHCDKIYVVKNKKLALKDEL